MKKGIFAAFLALMAIPGLGSAQEPPFVTGNPACCLATCFPPTDSVTDTPCGQVPPCEFCTPAPGVGPTCWVSTEDLLWWIRKGNTPPLVTTGDPNATVPGALGQPGTQVLFGGHGTIDPGQFSGLRSTLGLWLDDSWGLELSGFLFENRSVHFARASDAAGNPPLYIPFESNTPGATGEASYTIADPLFNGGYNGNVNVATSTRLWGAELNSLHRALSGSQWNLNVLAGFRYLGLDDGLVLSGASLNPPPAGFDENQYFRESFTTHNQFYGGQLGACFSWNQGLFSLDVAGKLALGVTHQVVAVAGTLTDVGTGSPVNGTLPQGVVFAMPTNIGRQTHEDFSVVPQLQVKLGYRLTEQLRATVGYDFLYWNQVVRAGDQMDRRVNDTQAVGQPLIGAALPALQRHATDFYAQGLSFGLEFRY